MATQESTVVVNYDIPDLVVVETLEEAFKKEEVEPDDNIPPGSGRDAQWFQRNQQKLAAMKRNLDQTRDVSISVNEKLDADDNVQPRARWKRGQGTPKPLARVREELKTNTGQVKVDTTKDGAIDVCVQSLSANFNKPVRVSMWIEEDAQKKAEAEAEKKATEHLNIVEGTTKALIRKMDMILRTADFAKEQEFEFHQKSIAMNRASHYWPMIRVAVLFITGFTFAHHIVSFFKTHHI
eukprot:CAMPEP_0197440776 /NCGR_PEP_ID=MMETSP1175-20131217/7198_1 /TAXON_ID=1003142 /ORGANISM="Triceratium dubium, Strain CCMP147" /LENGTH=237 /DNA_ID=CAMNT_0042970947 /DNA_START=175 /DNA_END=888 /DNA_ORIENTATION=-